MCKISIVFRNMVDNLKRLLEDNPKTKEKFVTELENTLHKYNSKNKRITRHELLKIVYGLINTETFLTEWLYKFYPEFEKEVGCLVNFYAREYLGFKAYTPSTDREEEKDSVTSPQKTSSKREILLSSSDLLLIENLLKDVLFLNAIEHVCSLLTRNPIFKKYHYFFNWKGFVKGNTTPFLLYAILEESKDASLGIAEFLDIIRKKKSYHTPKLSKDQRRAFDFSEILSGKYKEFRTWIAPYISQFREISPDLTNEDFFLLQLLMITPSKRGPQPIQESYLQRLFNKRSKDPSKFWQDSYSYYDSIREDKLIEKIRKSNPKDLNDCSKLAFLIINIHLNGKNYTTPFELSLKIKEDNLKSALEKFKQLAKEQQQEALNLLSKCSAELARWICDKFIVNL